MELFFKKSNEISASEKLTILSLFNQVFDKNRTIEEFDRQCLNNIFGYSYHTIIYDNGRLIAHAAYVPSYYFFNDQKVIVVDGIDGMIDKNYRDSSVLIELLQFNRKNLIKNGVQLEIGFPNSYAMKVYAKGKIYKKVGEMSTYVLPFRIGGIKNKLNFLNFLSVVGCRLLVFTSSLFANKKKTNYLLAKDDDSYNETRYKRMDGVYSRVKIHDFEFMYKIILYEGIRTAFLIDVTKKSAYNYNKAIKYILKNEAKNFDLLLYVGNLYFHSCGLIKIPKKFEPKQFNFAIKVLDKSIESSSLYEIKNWDVNLSNYDLI